VLRRWSFLFPLLRRLASPRNKPAHNFQRSPAARIPYTPTPPLLPPLFVGTIFLRVPVLSPANCDRPWISPAFPHSALFILFHPFQFHDPLLFCILSFSLIHRAKMHVPLLLFSKGLYPMGPSMQIKSCEYYGKRSPLPDLCDHPNNFWLWIPHLYIVNFSILSRPDLRSA